METLEQRYERLCKTPSDINEHLPTLAALAKQCRSVLELGTRGGVSTTAFLYAQPRVLTSVDIAFCKQARELAKIAGATDLEFIQADTRVGRIRPCDLLFIDTLHTYDQVRRELELNADMTARFIALHDTELFGERGEYGARGIWPAVEELVQGGKFAILQKFTNNNGLTILERVAT